LALVQQYVYTVVEQHIFVDDYTSTSLNRPQFKLLRTWCSSAQHADLDHERQHYNRQLVQCNKDLKRWEAMYLGKAIDLVDCKAKKADIDTRRASSCSRRARLDAEQRLIAQAQLEVASIMKYCARVRSQLQHFTLEEKRLAIEALNITVTWHPEKPPEIRDSISVTIVSSTSRNTQMGGPVSRPRSRYVRSSSPGTSPAQRSPNA